MTEHEIKELDSKGLREFGLTTGGMIALLFGLFFPWFLEFSFPVWPWVIFGILGLLGLAAPNSLRPVYRAWMKLALLLSKIMTPLVLGIIFYGVVMPMGLVMRLLGKDPMKRSMSDDEESYRVESNTPPREGIERPF